ncbi:hypothetical protein [Metabacillus sp. FJAT-53654]|uniref:Lipoprotein n=1 Tax=Metabacillus rhizosphaerae TaxID=3117747 RepID=A0ABZ2MWV6_9BACI
MEVAKNGLGCELIGSCKKNDRDLQNNQRKLQKNNQNCQKTI